MLSGIGSGGRFSLPEGIGGSLLASLWPRLCAGVDGALDEVEDKVLVRLSSKTPDEYECLEDADEDALDGWRLIE